MRASSARGEVFSKGLLDHTNTINRGGELFMKCIVKSTLAMMIVAAIASHAWAQDQVVLSTSNYNPLEGTPIGRTIGQAAFTKAMYIWVTANTGDEIAPQTVGFTDETI